METVSNETTLSKDTDPDDNEELKRGSSEHNKLLEEIQKLKADLNDARTQVTVTRLDLEARLDEQKQRNQSEITSLQQLVSEGLKRRLSEHNKLLKEVQKLKADLNNARTQVTVSWLDVEARLDEQKQCNQSGMADINEDLGAGGVSPGAEEVATPPADHLDENKQRPSLAIPGRKPGSTLYSDGNGYYFYSERVRYNRRFLKCSEKKKSNCMARASMGLEEGAPITPTSNSPFHNHQSNTSKGETMKLMAILRERAQLESEVQIAEILNEETVRHPEASYAISPVLARRAMKRARRATEPAIPFRT